VRTTCLPFMAPWSFFGRPVLAIPADVDGTCRARSKPGFFAALSPDVAIARGPQHCCGDGQARWTGAMWLKRMKAGGRVFRSMMVLAYVRSSSFAHLDRSTIPRAQQTHRLTYGACAPGRQTASPTASLRSPQPWSVSGVVGTDFLSRLFEWISIDCF